MDENSRPRPVAHKKLALRSLSLGGALGVSVVAAWLVPAMAQPGTDAAQAPSTIVGNVVGNVADLGALRGSVGVAVTSSSPASLLAVTASSTGFSGPVTPAGVLVGPSSPALVVGSTQGGGGNAPDAVTLSPRSQASPVSQPAAQPLAVTPTAVEQGGSSIGTTTSDGGGGGDSSTAVKPTAITGDTGSAQSLSSSSNSGDTGDANSSAISNPTSGSGASGASGGSGSTANTPSVSST